MEGSGVEKEPSRGLAEVPMPDAKRKDINIEDAVRKMEVEPTKTIELTKDEIMRLKELLMYKILEAGVEGVTNHIMRTMRDADEYLLNKLDGK
jgi:hypothetical protein